MSNPARFFSILVAVALLFCFPGDVDSQSLKEEATQITPYKEIGGEITPLGIVSLNAGEYTGDVATFWPTDLTELRLLIPQNAGRAEITAALRIVAHCVSRNAGRHLTINVSVLPEMEIAPFDSGQTSARTVLIRTMEKALVQLVEPSREGFPPLLMLAGPSEQLAAMADALFPEQSNDPQIVIPGVEAEQTGRRTLADLGQKAPVVLSAEQPDFHLPFSQADFGSSVGRMALHLIGTYHPKEQNASATLAVFLNGGLVQAMPLEQRGTFELLASFPSALLDRDNSLSLRLARSASDAPRTSDTFRITVEKSSYLEAEKGQTLQPGFERFPQVLLPEFQVAFDEVRPDTLQSAAQMVALLQGLTRRTLQPTVVEWEEAITSNKPLLAVVFNPARADNLNPPLQSTSFRLLGRDGQELLRLSPDACFALLQAYVHRKRDVLLLTHRDYPEGLVQLPRDLSRQEGWYNLIGTTWLQLSEGISFAVPIHDKAVRLRPIQYDPFSWWIRIRPLFFGMVATLVILCLFWIYPRVVRSQEGPLN